ncbi:Hypothetical_protein [Hexamita inflata]|uniref:Hypothetical_protein n=1 Tax=Hexamita inflata TaxID=28002 RepID=A0AA86PHF0_9EUKA|nr:Hypothetical protein HINF_LOCUS27275 [Hexamita inflata]
MQQSPSLIQSGIQRLQAQLNLTSMEQSCVRDLMRKQPEFISDYAERLRQICFILQENNQQQQFISNAVICIQNRTDFNKALVQIRISVVKQIQLLIRLRQITKLPLDFNLNVSFAINQLLETVYVPFKTELNQTLNGFFFTSNSAFWSKLFNELNIPESKIDNVQQIMLEEKVDVEWVTEYERKLAQKGLFSLKIFYSKANEVYGQEIQVQSPRQLTVQNLMKNILEVDEITHNMKLINTENEETYKQKLIKLQQLQQMIKKAEETQKIIIKPLILATQTLKGDKKTLLKNTLDLKQNTVYLLSMFRQLHKITGQSFNSNLNADTPIRKLYAEIRYDIVSLVSTIFNIEFRDILDDSFWTSLENLYEHVFGMKRQQSVSLSQFITDLKQEHLYESKNCMKPCRCPVPTCDYYEDHNQSKLSISQTNVQILRPVDQIPLPQEYQPQEQETKNQQNNLDIKKSNISYNQDRTRIIVQFNEDDIVKFSVNQVSTDYEVNQSKKQSTNLNKKYVVALDDILNIRKFKVCSDFDNVQNVVTFQKQFNIREVKYCVKIQQIDIDHRFQVQDWHNNYVKVDETQIKPVVAVVPKQEPYISKQKEGVLFIEQPPVKITKFDKFYHCKKVIGIEIDHRFQVLTKNGQYQFFDEQPLKLITKRKQLIQQFKTVTNNKEDYFQQIYQQGKLISKKNADSQPKPNIVNVSNQQITSIPLPTNQFSTVEDNIQLNPQTSNIPLQSNLSTTIPLPANSSTQQLSNQSSSIQVNQNNSNNQPNINNNSKTTFVPLPDKFDSFVQNANPAQKSNILDIIRSQIQLAPLQQQMSKINEIVLRSRKNIPPQPVNGVFKLQSKQKEETDEYYYYDEDELNEIDTRKPLQTIGQVIMAQKPSTVIGEK